MTLKSKTARALFLLFPPAFGGMKELNFNHPHFLFFSTPSGLVERKFANNV